MEIPIQIHGVSAAARGPAGPCGEFTIGQGEIMRVDAQAKPVRVACLVGTLWVTIENDPKDYILQRGEAVTLPGPGRILIQSLSCGKFCITAS